MRKLLTLVILLALPSIEGADNATDPEPLKIGLILPLTGPLAEYAVAFRNGVDLAKSNSLEIARNCSFLVEDSKCDPKTAVGALRKLATVDRVPVIYNWGGPRSDAVSSLAERSNMQ